MYKLCLTLLTSFVWAIPGTAQQVTRRANITGDAVDGKCTIEVIVDGSAEVEVQGSIGRMRNLSGKRPTWSRFVCNGRMPANAHDFRFRGIDGRGSVELLQDPRQTGGRIVFRIDDPQGGREAYTVDLEWRGSSGGQWNSQDTRGWRGPDSRGDGAREQKDSVDQSGPGRRFFDERGRWNTEGAAQAIRVCQAAATERIQRDGFRNVAFRNVAAANNPGRNDFVNGFATARQGRWRNTGFQFSCSVDLATGQVRSVDVNRR